ncbi:CoA-transferase family III [Meredithblackwellia eburnea MCA 4105]
MLETEAFKALTSLWSRQALPCSALTRVSFHGPPEPLPSAFALGTLSQATIAAAALSASIIHAIRTAQSHSPPHVSINSADAAAEFRSEQVATLDGEVGKVWDDFVGVYKAKNGWLRPHTNWSHHKQGLLHLLGLPLDAVKADLVTAFAQVDADEFAENAMKNGMVITALRSFQEWDSTPHGKKARELYDGPVKLTKLNNRPPKTLPPSSSSSRGPLAGVRVLDLTRVIAGPTAGRTLAAYGADVLWITAPHLPTLPPLDTDTSRGKRTIQLDLRPPSSDRDTFESLVRDADVVLQGYSPHSFPSSLGYTREVLLSLNPDLVVANLSAWGTGTGTGSEEGVRESESWEGRKGFDSLVQFATGVGVAEGTAWKRWKDEFGGEVLNPAGGENPARPLPCQALDHGSGYLLAFGIQAALYHRHTTGGSYLVENSLLLTALFLRSFSNPSSITADTFDRPLETTVELTERGQMEEMEGFGGKKLVAVRHAARIGREGEVEIGRGSAPSGYADDEARWLS